MSPVSRTMVNGARRMGGGCLAVVVALTTAVAGGCAASAGRGDDEAGTGGPYGRYGQEATGATGGTGADAAGPVEERECEGVGQPVEGQCNTPPPTACLDAWTLAEYPGVGACLDGRCSYFEFEIPCLGGCEGAVCHVCPAGAGTQLGPPGPRADAARQCWSRAELLEPGGKPTLETLADGGMPEVDAGCPDVDALYWGSPAGEGCGLVPVCSGVEPSGDDCCYVTSFLCGP